MEPQTLNRKIEIQNLLARFKGTDLDELNFLIELALDLS